MCTKAETATPLSGEAPLRYLSKRAKTAQFCILTTVANKLCYAYSWSVPNDVLARTAWLIRVMPDSRQLASNYY